LRLQKKEGVAGVCGSEEDHGLLQEREGHRDLRDGDDGAVNVETARPQLVPNLGRNPHPRMDQELNTY